MCVTWFAYAAIHGFTRATSSGSPPRNVASVPAFAPPAPPDTGASTQPTPALRSRRAASRAVSGWIVEWSTITLPRRAPGRRRGRVGARIQRRLKIRRGAPPHDHAVSAADEPHRHRQTDLAQPDPT